MAARAWAGSRATHCHHHGHLSHFQKAAPAAAERLADSGASRLGEQSVSRIPPSQLCSTRIRDESTHSAQREERRTQRSPLAAREPEQVDRILRQLNRSGTGLLLRPPQPPCCNRPLRQTLLVVPPGTLPSRLRSHHHPPRLLACVVWVLRRLYACAARWQPSRHARLAPTGVTKA